MVKNIRAMPLIMLMASLKMEGHKTRGLKSEGPLYSVFKDMFVFYDISSKKDCVQNRYSRLTLLCLMMFEPNP